MHGTARQRLQARLARGAEWTALRLDGVIDEHNGLDHLLGQPTDEGPALLIDLGGVRRINSVGVRDWVVWLRAARLRYRTVVLFDCPPAIVNEINLVKNFAQGAVISTFVAPYFCDRCGLESTQVLDALAMIASGSRKAPAAPCGKPACANTLDDAEESYFAFFDDVAALDVAVDVTALVAAARAALREAPHDAGAAEANDPAGPRRSLDTLSASATANVGGHAPSSSAARPKGPPGPATPPDGGRHSNSVTRGRGSRDLAFVAIVLLMLATLGVLVYLITTLE